MSMSTSDFFFGWDLLYKTIENSINNKSDIIIALVHFLLIKRSKFRCIGIGEDKTLTENETRSELLPDGWNEDTNKYALRYTYDKQLFLLLGHRSEDSIIINFMDIKKRNVSNIALDPETVVKGTKGPINELIPAASKLVERLHEELVRPIFSGTTKEVTTQTVATTTPGEEHREQLLIIDPIGRRQSTPDTLDPRPFGFPGVGRGDLDPRPFGFPDVGRGDLDPLGRLGSGNLLRFPPHPNLHGQPRFDPFGPPDGSVRPNSNPDHLQPPNFGGFNYY